MVLLQLIAIIVCLILNDRHKTAQANKKINAMIARGEFRNQNYQLFNKAWQDAEYDWQHDRKMFPEEYRAYLERNPEAKKSYIVGLVGEQETKAGCKPVLCPPSYDKNTFDPFRQFGGYKDKIKTFNETGRLDY